MDLSLSIYTLLLIPYHSSCMDWGCCPNSAALCVVFLFWIKSPCFFLCIVGLNIYCRTENLYTIIVEIKQFYFSFFLLHPLCWVRWSAHHDIVQGAFPTREHHVLYQGRENITWFTNEAGNFCVAAAVRSLPRPLCRSKPPSASLWMHSISGKSESIIYLMTKYFILGF